MIFTKKVCLKQNQQTEKDEKKSTFRAKSAVFGHISSKVFSYWKIIYCNAEFHEWNWHQKARWTSA